MAVLIDPKVMERVEALEVTFGAQGFDHFGVSKRELGRFFTMLGWFYHHYFRITVHGAEHVPKGRAMLVGNHSGGYAVDGAMTLAAAFFALDPPRLLHAMAEKFMGRLPFVAPILDRLGQLTGLPEHAVRLLNDDRQVLVFPEGIRGTAKLFWEQDSLVRFGTGFMRLALQTGSPIVPVAVVGAGEAVPTVYNAYGLGRRLGVPYVPFTPYLLPLPLPAKLDILFGEALHFAGDGRESDAVVQSYIEQVKDTIAAMIRDARRQRTRQRDAERKRREAST